MAIFCIFVSAVVVLAAYVATCVASLFAASDGSELCPSAASAGHWTVITTETLVTHFSCV